VQIKILVLLQAQDIQRILYLEIMLFLTTHHFQVVSTPSDAARFDIVWPQRLRQDASNST